LNELYPQDTDYQILRGFSAKQCIYVQKTDIQQQRLYFWQPKAGLSPHDMHAENLDKEKVDVKRWKCY